MSHSVPTRRSYERHIDVKEFSSGTSDRDAAAHLMTEHETKLRHRLMFGPAAIVAQGKIADAFESYLIKSKPPARPTSCARSEEHTSELQSLMRTSYAVFCLQKKQNTHTTST